MTINSSTRTIDTALVLTLAAWLIFNSHLERFYPLPWLAADGMLGNALFYLLSGYGIQSTLQGREQSLREYAYRRLIRLYPAVLAVLALQTALRAWAGAPSRLPSNPTVLDCFEHFIWPTQYTYVQVIVPFYALLWVINRGTTRILVASLLLAGMLFAVGYATTPLPQSLVLGVLPPLIWWPFFWLLVGTGAMFARVGAKSKFTIARVVLLLGILAAYFAAKYGMVVLNRFVEFYPILHILVLAACAGIFMTLCQPEFVATCLRLPLLGPFIAISAALTLEIFLVHVVFVDFLYTISFPLNIVVLAVVTLIGAQLVSSGVKLLRQMIEKDRTSRRGRAA